jgi:hypothetical protein
VSHFSMGIFTIGTRLGYIHSWSECTRWSATQRKKGKIWTERVEN